MPKIVKRQTGSLVDSQFKRNRSLETPAMLSGEKVLRFIPRQFALKGLALAGCVLIAHFQLRAADAENPGQVVIRANVSPDSPKGFAFPVGGASPDGHILSA